jgi:NAD(P)-dependent dehydrogenase (short-subunit alcohol dehydrogenase family)
VLDGRVVLVTGGGQPLGDGLARGLGVAGARVGMVEGDCTERSGAQRAVDAAVAAVGRPHALVHAAIAPLAVEPRTMVDTDDDRWATIWEGTMRASLWLCQAVHPHLAGNDGRIVFVTPTISMSGAGSLTPWATAIEGQRLLAKSAARQWGADGITVNCIAPSATLCGLDPAAVGDMALSAPALGRAGDAEADLAPIVAFLCGPESRFLTGATLSADGGVWMAP